MSRLSLKYSFPCKYKEGYFTRLGSDNFVMYWSKRLAINFTESNKLTKIYE